jgi:hypothetical protein
VIAHRVRGLCAERRAIVAADTLSLVDEEPGDEQYAEWLAADPIRSAFVDLECGLSCVYLDEDIEEKYMTLLVPSLKRLARLIRNPDHRLSELAEQASAQSVQQAV